MELSKRLLAVASLVTEGASVADIGTDHGYVPIYLVKHKKADSVIAMDINQAPLDKARQHIKAYHLEEKIVTRKSDGLKEVSPGEVSAMIAAGMGGGLVIHILEDSPAVVEQLKEFILQPQSEIFKVRTYLNEQGFSIIEEDMIEENGKFYPMMKAIHGREERFSEEELYYGRKLLENKNPVLYKYLCREEEKTSEIIEKLKTTNSERMIGRVAELEGDLLRIKKALARYR